MMKAFLVLALALCATTAGAQKTFSAVTKAGASGGAAEGSLWVDAATGEAEWVVNATGLAPGAAVALAIVDGDPATTLETVVVLGNGTADAEGGLEAGGAFGPADLTAAYAAMSFEELAGHLGMGHVFLEVAAPEGKLHGVWAEAGAPAVTAADGADGHAHGMGEEHDQAEILATAKKAADAKQAANPMAMPAADAHDHGDGEVHSHRRRLLLA